MLDSSDAMTSQECRYLWEIAKLQYADIEPYDLDALQGYIAIECAESCRKGETPRYTIPRRKDDSLCYKMNPDGGIAKAYLKIDCPGQWNGREAVSFNSDGSSDSAAGLMTRTASRFTAPGASGAADI